MPDLSVTDSLGNPVDISTVKWTSGSSLYNYLKSELLHLAVAPDYIKVKDQSLSAAAPKPANFTLSVEHDFQLGGAAPEIDLTPGSKIALLVNATAGSGLFDDDPFQLPATVPAQIGYVGMSFDGSLDLGVSGSAGDLTFGFDGKSSVTLEFLKAFPAGPKEPTVWAATSAMLGNFVIPASIDDLKRLNTDDICCVSGDGSLKVSGAVNVSLPVNPLASVNLPLGVGTLSVKDGLMAGLSASLTISGSYQIRVQKLTGGAIRLSYLRKRGSEFVTDLTASVGIQVDVNSTDLLAKLLGAISTDTVDPKLLGGLTSDEISSFTSTLKDAMDHSVQASMDLALSESAQQETVFQYDIQPENLDSAAANAVNRALKGDLRLLTALEGNAGADGAIAPGVKLLNSVFSTAKTRGFSLKLNLLGIVNVLSSSKLIGKCEFLFEPASGDLTIKETAQSDRISAITDPYKKQQALCKAMFDSVLVTTAYVVGKSVTMPALSCQTVHFASHQNSGAQTISDYTNWFVALNLMTPAERQTLVNNAGHSDASTCVVRAPLEDAGCEALFFNAQANLRTRAEYVEIGREALRALLDPVHKPLDGYRYDFLNNDATWTKAVATGPSDALRDLIPLQPTDPRLAVVLNDVTHDLADIVWWADSMQKAGSALRDMRAFLAGHNPAALANDPDFAKRRDALQKLMLGVVGASRVRFDEPWGMVCLYWASGSRRSSGQISAGTLAVQRDSPPPVVTKTGG